MWAMVIFGAALALAGVLGSFPVDVPHPCFGMLCPPGTYCKPEIKPGLPHAHCTPIIITVPKPGTCPRGDEDDDAVGHCPSTCRQDSDCEDADKCCPTSCGGTTCQEPAENPVRSSSCKPVTCRPGEQCVLLPIFCIHPPCPKPQPTCIPCWRKPGGCPRQAYRLSSLTCHHECQCDFQCPGAQKCCPTLCGGRCLDTGILPPLSCASVDCKPGYKCSIEHRCDEHGCSPRPCCVPDNSKCPSYPPWVKPRCFPYDACSEDDSEKCPPGTICCHTPCGRRCIKPL